MWGREIPQDKLCAESPGIIPAPGAGGDCTPAHRLCRTCPQASPRVSSVLVEPLADVAQVTLKAHILEREVGDLLDGVQRGGVVASTEGGADHRQ